MLLMPQKNQNAHECDWIYQDYRAWLICLWARREDHASHSSLFAVEEFHNISLSIVDQTFGSMLEKLSIHHAYKLPHFFYQIPRCGQNRWSNMCNVAARGPGHAPPPPRLLSPCLPALTPQVSSFPHHLDKKRWPALVESPSPDTCGGCRYYATSPPPPWANHSSQPFL